MQTEFAEPFLRCPACGADRTLRIHASTVDAHEVREGTLTCAVCGREFALHRGVAHLLLDPPHHVEREAAGLERFAEQMRAQGWTQQQLFKLPVIHDGYWYVQAVSFHQLSGYVDFQPGQTVLDVGSNTCWASNRFAQRGLRPIALDITTTELQGLYTADYFIEAGESYFERVLGSMTRMPIASGSLDYVFCCEVLHHNDFRGLLRTFREAHRVLKPGGKLLVVNETLRTLRSPRRQQVEWADQFEGYEHAYFANQYRLGATLAGFSTQLLVPAYHPAFLPREPPGTQERPSIRRKIEDRAARNRIVRRARLMWLNHISGGVQFGMIATKRG